MSVDMNIYSYLYLIKNEKRRQAVVKLRSGNHKLRIETDRYHLSKIPENRRICQLCSSNKVENEIHFLLKCNLNKNLRQHFFQDVEAKYSKFIDLIKSEKVLFLFNNIDPYVCKKLVYYVYGAFQLREFYSMY